jgi:iron complex transport system substrate-binding protein
VSLEPNTIADIFDNIKTIGELTGTRAKAEQVVGELENRLNKLRDQTAEAEKRPRVFMLEWLEPPFAPGHWTPEQVEIAGGFCVLGEAGEKSVTTNYSEISESNPDVIVLVPCGYYIADVLRQLPNTIFPENFREISAFQNDEIWAMDASAYFRVPRRASLTERRFWRKFFTRKFSARRSKTKPSEFRETC